MGYIDNYNGLDPNKYSGNKDFRGFLAANGYEKFLPYVGNDGNGDFRKMAQNPEYADQAQRNLGGGMQELYNWWADKTRGHYVKPQGGGGSYNPQAAAEAKARADEIAKYREQERVAAEGLGRLDRQRDIWRGNVENNYANQLNDLENSYTQSKGAYEMNKRDSEAQNRAVRSQIMEDANNQTNSLRQMFAAGGAGDSSAAQIVAPWAVGLEASRNAGSAQDAFARDRRNQDLELASATNIARLFFNAVLLILGGNLYLYKKTASIGTIKSRISVYEQSAVFDFS